MVRYWKTFSQTALEQRLLYLPEVSSLGQNVTALVQYPAQNFYRYLERPYTLNPDGCWRIPPIGEGEFILLAGNFGVAAHDFLMQPVHIFASFASAAV